MKTTLKTMYVGMDVHKESVSVAVLGPQGHQARPTLTIANEPRELRRLFTRLKREGEVRACYEAGEPRL